VRLYYQLNQVFEISDACKNEFAIEFKEYLYFANSGK